MRFRHAERYVHNILAHGHLVSEYTKVLSFSVVQCTSFIKASLPKYIFFKMSLLSGNHNLLDRSWHWAAPPEQPLGPCVRTLSILLLVLAASKQSLCLFLMHQSLDRCSSLMPGPPKQGFTVWLVVGDAVA